MLINVKIFELLIDINNNILLILLIIVFFNYAIRQILFFHLSNFNVNKTLKSFTFKNKFINYINEFFNFSSNNNEIMFIIFKL